MTAQNAELSETTDYKSSKDLYFDSVRNMSLEQREQVETEIGPFDSSLMNKARLLYMAYKRIGQ